MEIMSLEVEKKQMKLAKIAKHINIILTRRQKNSCLRNSQ